MREEEKRRGEEARERERQEHEMERREHEEEKKRLDAEREQERQRREEENRVREEQELQRREEEWRQRDREFREALSKIAEAKSDPSKPGGESEFRVAKLNEKDDIEAYLTTFKRLMAAYGVTRAKWIFKLAPQLTGKAQLAYAALPTNQALDYDSVKSAILRRYDITEETYRQRFRAVSKGTEETHRQLAIRMGDLVNKWLKDISTVEQIKDAVVLEQFLNCLSSPIRVWIKERKPKSCLEAGQLADNYTEARKQVKEEKYSGESNQKGKQIVTSLMLPGKATTIHCVHGDNLLYPVARLNLEVEGVPVAVEAAVAKNLPTSVLLGTDVPELGRLLGLKPRSRWNKTQRALLAVTRAGARRQAKEEEERRQKEADCQVTSSPVTLDAQSTDEVAAATKGKEAPERHQVGEIKGNDGFVFNLSDDLFSGDKSRVELSRSQKRAQKRMHQPAAEQLSSGPLDMSAKELKQLVKLDPSLSNLKVTGNKEDKTHYFLDTLYPGAV